MSFRGAVLVPWNVNAVHDMRVALRRLRSALRDFVQVIDEKPLKRVKDDLKKVADALGAIRDLDVAVIALDEFASQSSNNEIVEGIGEIAERSAGPTRAGSHSPAKNSRINFSR